MTQQHLTEETQGHVRLIGLNRPSQRNAFGNALLDSLAAAYGRMEDDQAIRVGVLHAAGDHFTAGLDLAEVADRITSGGLTYADPGAIDPWGLVGRKRTKPLVVATQGWCMTLGIELMLAADVRVAASNSRFSQMEVCRGIYPFGGATLRFPRETGWGNAMRWMLTGEEFGAIEAQRIGLVQEVVEPGLQLERAVQMAERIADQAPLGIRMLLESARPTWEHGQDAAAEQLVPGLLDLLSTEDAAEGVMSFVERRPAAFVGR